MQSLSGETHTIDVHPDTHVTAVKLSLESQLDIPYVEQRLIYLTDVLEDDSTLSHYNIKNQTTLQLIVEPVFPVHFWTRPYEGDDVEVFAFTLESVRASDTIDNVKAKIEQLMKTEPSVFAKYFEQEPVSDLASFGLYKSFAGELLEYGRPKGWAKTFSDYNIQKNDVIYLEWFDEDVDYSEQLLYRSSEDIRFSTHLGFEGLVVTYTDKALNKMGWVGIADVSNLDTISNVKARIQEEPDMEEFELTHARQRLFFAGQLLEEGRTLLDYGFDVDKNILYMEIVNT